MSNLYKCLAITLVSMLPWTAARADGPGLVAESSPVFERPHDLVVSDRGLLYVADLGNDRVQVLDPVSLIVIGSIGAGELSAPHDVSFDREKNLLVADSGNDRIAVYRLTTGTTGKLLREVRGELKSPEGVVLDADGRLIIANTGANQLVVINPDGSRVVVDGRTQGIGPLARPHDVDVGADGRIYLTDPGNNRIVIFDRTLKQASVLGGPGIGFNEPKYLALDPAGRLYVADEHNNAIRVFDQHGKELLNIKTVLDSDKRSYSLNRPEGVAVAGRRLWISDTYNNRLLVLDTGL